jgi:hypothetical protein
MRNRLLSCARKVGTLASRISGSGLQELFYIAGDNIEEEEGLDDTMCAFRALIRRYAEDWRPACSLRCDQLENHVVRLAHKGSKRFLWSWWYRRLFLSVMPILNHHFGTDEGRITARGLPSETLRSSTAFMAHVQCTRRSGPLKRHTPALLDVSTITTSVPFPCYRTLENDES